MGLLEDDPVDLLLDSDHEIVFTKEGDLAFVRGLEGVAQHLRIQFKLFREEWFLNLDKGFPYLAPKGEAVLGSKFDGPRVRDLSRNIIMNTPGVLSIEKLTASFDRVERKLRISYVVRSVFGVISDEVTV